ncbi:MAG: ABC transporter ATP-binding protein [Candidatus Tectomicrobia bacterium]|uniref:ABC transporter ATP-binding protein n=1 Tax=Tectimicrobiota bacterium TaxID=2528274 RepID=A0A932M0U8_UNCTE|nr:ABC transporter ATP-binding protein [Candidatus Tectomicrobia bacterium]
MSLLQVKRITKHFGGLTALSDLSFSVEEGKVFGLIGPNGAGKTTLLNIISGFLKATSGNIILQGKSITGCHPHILASRGISRTFQNGQIFGNMTALENVMVGCHIRFGGEFLNAALQTGWSRRQEGEIRQVSVEILASMGLQAWAQEPADSLPFGLQRLLEIARGVATKPRLLLLDEPAAGLNREEKERLTLEIARLRCQGITIILVEHDMDVVMSICDRLVVLNYGQKIAEGTPEEVQKDREVVAAYLGDEDGFHA